MTTEALTKKTILTKAADWVKANKSWLLVLAVLLAAALLALWALDAHRSAQLSALRAEYAAATEKLKAAEAETEAARKVLADKTAALAALQTANDRHIREVTADAYKKARALSDDDLLAAYNRLISGARSRNADRERANTGD
ncbi:hypothetical protein [Cloacibacillus evryensis]|uniref:hypothetical protein n=1 Tax=Cloacibacillus evryensis TaxID=508460 RepID=UPI0026722BB0|nr:hypothetical protein [Cloacibacillus evryensis]